MTSAIDVLKPTAVVATTASVRANFQTAKTEIEALQTRTGYADYNDVTTQTTPISPTASTWTKLTNDKAGVNTRSRLPSGVTNLWNASTNRLVLTELPVDSVVDVRLDLTVTTTGANQVVKLRTQLAIGDPIQFEFESTEMLYKTAGVHKVVVSNSFYIGSDIVRLNPGEFQIFSDASSTVKVNGWFFRVIKAIA